MNTDLFVKLFAHVANPPTFKTEEDAREGTKTVVIEGTPLSVWSYSIKVAGIAGDHTVTMYNLAASTEDDYIDLYKDSDLRNVIVKAVGEYVEWRCRNTLDEMAWDAYAADLEEDRRMLQEAYDAGRAYFNATSPEKRTRADNPYPYGIEHYNRWMAGYLNAEAESVF